jgi:hypothetical protein
MLIETKNAAYKILVGKPDGKRPVAKPKRRWEDNIKRTFGKKDVRVWIRSIWLRIQSCDGLL